MEVDLALCGEYDYGPHSRPPSVVFEELPVESLKVAVPRDRARPKPPEG